MKSEERAHEIVSGLLEICGVEIHDKRPQLEAFVAGHLDEIERSAAEKAVTVYREKATEASSTVLSHTTIGAPSKSKGD